MKGKIIVPNQTKNYNLFSIIVSFVIGIILITNSNSVVTIGFQIVGACIALYGIYRLIQFFNIKKQFKTEDNNALITGIIGITIGLLTILLASVIEVGLRYLLGLFLIIKGISRLNIALSFKTTNKTAFITNCTESIILILLGLYTILFANAALMIIGILLILSACIDLFSFLTNKK